MERSIEVPRNNLKVEVSEMKESDGRKIVITILAPEEEFTLGDLLAQRKKITPCAAALKDAAIEGIKSWWKSAEQVVAGAGNEQASAEGMSPKRERKSKAVSPPDEVASRRVKPEPVNGAVATTSASGS
jgi:hypothetical protein